jgi:hypothetical protein
VSGTGLVLKVFGLAALNHQVLPESYMSLDCRILITCMLIPKFNKRYQIYSSSYL